VSDFIGDFLDVGGWHGKSVPGWCLYFWKNSSLLLAMWKIHQYFLMEKGLLNPIFQH